ncbi:hypothetical protein [Hydrogenophaga sp. PBL-H3]|uniref:hypothetical protein n=1 Tax=Hydrogenophaga sp. PBL-H3 TaxID=434010 RepID=UPI00131F9EC4|nr:hypothetical protein [Hydrogenophaga sp. PBL-H3]QHE77968.1 hypothetical protein F9Z45_19010 [Hydrogenophaga sp. PBL-H3]QHE82393.1 hypothetical protein F9Z44_19010 [Hydrogenophaga sp. PBL-H3]
MGIHALTQEVIKHLGLKTEVKLPATDEIDSEVTPSSISDDYQDMIKDCFQMLGLGPDQIRIMVRSVGLNPAGLEVYAAFVKVVRWDASVVDMLAKMPVIEKKIDRRVRQSSMVRYSAFAGLWFRSPADVNTPLVTVH